MAGTRTQNPMIRRKKPLRSKTADTLFHILSFCYKHQSKTESTNQAEPNRPKPNRPFSVRFLVLYIYVGFARFGSGSVLFGLLRFGFRFVFSLKSVFGSVRFGFEPMLSPSDRGDTNIVPITKDDVPLDCTDILPNDSLCQEDASMDETRVVLDTQEDGLFNTQLKLAEPDHNVIVEITELCHKTDPSVSFDVITKIM